MALNYDELFGSDAGEDEDRDALRGYFVDLPEFTKFYSSKHPLVIVRGRKGMGKSALLNRLAIRLEDDERSDDIVIRATGNELMGMGDFTNKSSAYLENHWKQVICKRICVEIGKRLNLALSDSAISMVEAAELEGYKGLNVVSALTERVGGLLQKVLQGKPEEGFGAAKPGFLKKGVSSPVEALRQFQEKTDRAVWVLIDDIDAKYVDDDENQQRVGAFFSAVRSLAFGVTGLRVRASVRTDVWKNLRRMEDQDKIRQYVIDIYWRDRPLRLIFSKRILAYLLRENYEPASSWDAWRDFDKLMAVVFAPHFKWGTRNEEPFVPIKILAGTRPRWMGQLCKLAGNHAGRERITMRDVDLAMPEFGQEKISDIQKEHLHQFEGLPKLINVFKGGRREYNRFQLLSAIEEKYVKKMADEPIPTINGYPYQALDQLAEFLFQIEFINAHRANESQFQGFHDDPDLFSAEENKQNKILWAVNPSYRKFLRIV